MKSKPKVVFDTNIYISAIIFGGNPRTCLELSRQGKIELFISKSILFELSQKLKLKFKWQDSDIIDVVEGLSKFVKIVEPDIKISIIKSDPTDNKILECAKKADVDFIVSGDVKHVLSLKKFGNAKIINAKEFLDIYYEENS